MLRQDLFTGVLKEVSCCAVFSTYFAETLSDTSSLQKDSYWAVQETFAAVENIMNAFCNTQRNLQLRWNFGLQFRTLFFVLIVLATVVGWITSLQQTDVNFKLTWYSQIAGSLLIAFKFSFPVLAASRVTTKFDNTPQLFNKQLTHQDFPEGD